MGNGSSLTNFTGYDALGNVASSNQQVGGQTYSFSYQWYLPGSLHTETYPSGRVITIGYDSANRSSSVTGQLGSASTAYASSVQYAPHGGPSYFLLGNNVARTLEYNSRLQAGCRWDGLGGNPSYALFQECPNWGTANNNGTLQSTTISAGGPAQLSSLPSVTASYGYL